MEVTKHGIRLNVEIELIKQIYIQSQMNKQFFIKHFLSLMDLMSWFK